MIFLLIVGLRYISVHVAFLDITCQFIYILYTDL